MECHYEVAEHCMFNKTRMVSRYITNHYTKALKETGLTPVQYAMMTAIKLLEEANINNLSSATQIDRTTINRNLKPLIRDDRVYIKESEDRRQRIISLTKAGEESYKKGYEKWKEAQDALYTKLGKENWEALNGVLDNTLKIINS
ncbi:MAG: MarR family winged helix-turn-helix transcriptional regulator [Epsilonproteobacteria bacterium]|nr:MarR family winged helix-turn-helix transcriptional regulator [Campylobacterota bacterium]